MADQVYNADINRRSQYLRRWSALQTERSSWFNHWRELSQYLLPRTGRFFITDRNRGEKRNNNIYDSTGTRAVRVLAAGMMAGMTSPARPWFRLATTDEQLMESSEVKIWLEDVGTLIRDIFARGNTYRALHTTYEELGCFGTFADIVLPDFNEVLRHYPLTAGQYALASNERDEVDTLFREFEMTVSNIVGQFVYGGVKTNKPDWSKVSPTVKNLWDNQRGIDSWISVMHAIEPRKERDPRYGDAKNMPFKSCYFETGGNADIFLRESGFKRFPALCPRWVTTAGDIYGSSPGMEALGDVKQLQHQQLRKAQGIDYMVKPPLQAPPGMKSMDINTLPGGVSFAAGAGQQGGIQTAWEVRLDLSHLLADIQDVRQRIDQTFYTDLFLMLANDTQGNMTAREVAERHEEKMLMLGPVLERLQNELLKPLVDIAFDRCIESGIVPKPPKELQGHDLNIEFVSVLAQAQRAVGISSVDRLLGTVASIAQFQPNIIDKLDPDEIVDKYADMLGVDPQLIVSSDKVAVIRDQRAKVQAQQAQAAQMAQASQTAKNLAQAPTEGKNALTDLTNQFSGYTIPQGAA